MFSVEISRENMTSSLLLEETKKLYHRENFRLTTLKFTVNYELFVELR